MGGEKLAQKGVGGGGKVVASIAPGEARRPGLGLALGHGQKVAAPQAIELTRADTELRGGFHRRKFTGTKTLQKLPGKQTGTARGQLTVVFMFAN